MVPMLPRSKNQKASKSLSFSFAVPVLRMHAQNSHNSVINHSRPAPSLSPSRRSSSPIQNPTYLYIHIHPPTGCCSSTKAGRPSKSLGTHLGLDLIFRISLQPPQKDIRHPSHEFLISHPDGSPPVAGCCRCSRLGNNLTRPNYTFDPWPSVHPHHRRRRHFGRRSFVG